MEEKVLKKFSFLVEKNINDLHLILENSLDIFRKLKEKSEIYKLEEKTWKLLESISSFEVVDYKTSQQDYEKVQNIINSQENLSHFLSVRLWTEEIVFADSFSKNNNYFPDTTSYLRSFADVEENIVTEIDPDAADRQGKNWKLQDQIYQQELLKSIFLKLRRGDLGNYYRNSSEAKTRAKREFCSFSFFLFFLLFFLFFLFFFLFFSFSTFLFYLKSIITLASLELFLFSLIVIKVLTSSWSL